MLLFWGWAHPSVIQFRQGYVAHSPRVRKKGGILFLFTLSFSILSLGLGAIKSPFDRLPAVLGSMFYVCLSPNIRLLGLVSDGGAIWRKVSFICYFLRLKNASRTVPKN